MNASSTLGQIGVTLHTADMSVDELLAALSDEESTRVVNKVLDVVIAGL